MSFLKLDFPKAGTVINDIEITQSELIADYSWSGGDFWRVSAILVGMRGTGLQEFNLDIPYDRHHIKTYGAEMYIRKAYECFERHFQEQLRFKKSHQMEEKLEASTLWGSKIYEPPAWTWADGVAPNRNFRDYYSEMNERAFFSPEYLDRFNPFEKVPFRAQHKVDDLIEEVIGNEFNNELAIF